MSGIKLSFYKEINSGSLASSFNLVIPSLGLTLVDCKLFIKDSKKWIGWPSTSYEGKDGQKKYKKLAFFDREKEVRLLSLIRKLIDEKQYTTYDQDMARIKEEMATRNGDRARPQEEVQAKSDDLDEFSF